MRATGTRSEPELPLGIRGFSTIGIEIPLIAAWAAITIAITIRNGAFTNEAFLLVLMAVLALALAVANRSSQSKLTYVRGAVGVALATGTFVSVYFPAGIYGSGGFLALSRGVTTASAAVAMIWALLNLDNSRRVTYAIVVAMSLAGVSMILSSPKPAIDVWYMLQAATGGLSHGHNFYTLQWTSGIPLEVKNQFVYLPGAAVLLWPFHAVFGDVRYGLLLAMVGTAVILTRVTTARALALLPCLALLYPKAMFGLEQSWVDPLVLFAVCLTAYLVLRGHPNWAMAALVIGLICKQTCWLLLPLAIIWKDFGWRRTAAATGGALIFILPWVVAAPGSFYGGAIRYNLFLSPRSDSLSLYSLALRHGVRPGLAMTAAALLVAFALAMWRLHLSTGGLLISAAFVMAAFNLTDKVAFFNEWGLAAGLTLAAAAFGCGQRADSHWVDSAGQLDCKVETPKPAPPDLTLIGTNR